MGLSALPARDFAEGGTEVGLARAMAWGTSLIAIVVGSLGMLNTMLTSVLERVSEIGVLKALGWPKSLVARMILLEALLLSAVGAGVGVLAGLMLTRGLGRTHWLTGLAPSELPWTVLALSVGVAMVIGGLGGWYPAACAARLSVVEALRYE
jgi:putative ABC transport system permease protein